MRMVLRAEARTVARGAVVEAVGMARSEASQGAKEICEAATTSQAMLGPVTKFGPKIEGQLGKRGWNKESVERLISSPARREATRDTRAMPGGGRLNDPATAFINSKGDYVIRNDVSGDIVQISNKFDVDWSSPF